MSVSFDQAVMAGLDASKPAASAGTAGRLYFATDTGITYRDNGASWDEVANDLQLGTTATTAAAGDDARLSDARTPTAHASTHHTAGSDPLAAADIGAEPALGNPASNGYVLSSTTAGARSWVAQTGGGGGGSITSGTYASRPAAGTAGALYFATDVPMLYRDTGSAWERYPLREVIATQPPAASGFTAQNAGTATLTDDADGLLYSYAKGTTGGDLNCRGFTVAAPATPWTWTVRLRAYIHCGSETDASTSAQLQIGARESSTGKRTVLNLNDYQYHNLITFDHWAGDATYGAGVGVPTPPWGGWHNCPPLRVKDDGTTLSLQLSYDGGRNWYTIYSEARTSYMAGGPNQLYIGGRITGNAVAANAIVVARIEGWSVA